MARTCLFCGGPANSKEHVFPSWVDGIAPGDGKLGHGRGDDSATRAGWEADGYDLKVRQVCKTCNETWMSILEARTRELLTPLILGTRSASLSVPEQKKVAVWGYKTAIMAALAYPEEERFVPAEDYRYFYEHRTPPNGTWVWIGALAADLGGNSYSAGFSRSQKLDFWKADGSPVQGHGYRISISVVSLVFEVMRDPHGSRITREYDDGEIWTRIRPISKGQWPPRVWLTPHHVADLHNGTIETRKG